MRKRISERNIFPNFNLYEEYRKIEYLLSETKCVGREDAFGMRYNPQYSIEEYVNNYHFNEWHLRGTFTSIAEMRRGFNIDNKSISDNPNEDIILDYLQYILNIMALIQPHKLEKECLYIKDPSVIDVIIDNTKLLIKHLNCHISVDKSRKELFIEYDNELSSIIETNIPEISVSLSEYKRIDNRGDLKRKSEILCTLYKMLESYSDDFKGTTYNGLYSDTKLLFNKSGVRHNVDKDAIACATFLKMDEKELEKWYDRIFDMFLSCMVITQYLKDKKDIENIKKAIGD